MSDAHFEQPGRRTCQLMSAVPGDVLDRCRFRVQQLGTEGARLMAGQRDQKTGAGR